MFFYPRERPHTFMDRLLSTGLPEAGLSAMIHLDLPIKHGSQVWLLTMVAAPRAWEGLVIQDVTTHEASLIDGDSGGGSLGEHRETEPGDRLPDFLREAWTEKDRCITTKHIASVNPPDTEWVRVGQWETWTIVEGWKYADFVGRPDVRNQKLGSITLI
jgi:hypothetical protein